MHKIFIIPAILFFYAHSMSAMNNEIRRKITRITKSCVYDWPEAPLLLEMLPHQGAEAAIKKIAAQDFLWATNNPIYGDKKMWKVFHELIEHHNQEASAHILDIFLEEAAKHNRQDIINGSYFFDPLPHLYVTHKMSLLRFALRKEKIVCAAVLLKHKALCSDIQGEIRLYGYKNKIKIEKRNLREEVFGFIYQNTVNLWQNERTLFSLVPAEIIHNLVPYQVGFQEKLLKDE